MLTASLTHCSATTVKLFLLDTFQPKIPNHVWLLHRIYNYFYEVAIYKLIYAVPVIPVTDSGQLHIHLSN